MVEDISSLFAWVPAYISMADVVAENLAEESIVHYVSSYGNEFRSELVTRD